MFYLVALLGRSETDDSSYCSCGTPACLQEWNHGVQGNPRCQ